MNKKILIFFVAILFISCNQSTNPSYNKNTDNVSSNNIIDSQQAVNLILKEKLRNADTVLLISHVDHEFDSVKRETTAEILLNNKLNKKIIKEQKAVTGISIDSLINVMVLPTNNDSLVSALCFNPHHSVIIFKATKISYIDMCFHCWNLRTSEDLNAIHGYEIKKWKEIYLFFRRLGFKYEMQEKE